ncbi:hypothetical protein ACP4OV_026807 [Aristida adscensionis]
MMASTGGAHRRKTTMSSSDSRLRRRRSVVVRRRQTVFIRMLTGKTRTFEVDLSSETIAGVKWMIYEEEGIDPNQQHLIFGGRMLENYRTLADQDVWHEATLSLILRLRGGADPPETSIHIRKITGEVITLQVDLSSTFIYEVRARIASSREGILPSQQHLVFAGQKLDDGLTLADYNIQENSVLQLALGPHRGSRPPTPKVVLLKDKHEPLKDAEQAPGTYSAAVDEGSSQDYGKLPPGFLSLVFGDDDEDSSQLVEASSEVQEQPSVVGIDQVVFHGTDTPANQLEQQQRRWSKYSLKVLVFAITMFATYHVSATSLSTWGIAFKTAIGFFFIAEAALSILMPPKWGDALVCLSWFLLEVASYLLLVSFNKYYVYAIIPVLLAIVAAVLQLKFWPGVQQTRTNNEANQNADVENADQDHNPDDDESHHFDSIFDLSGDIVNCGGIITVIFGNSMVGPASALGFLFFYTIALGLYLMMVTTVRSVALTPHVRYLVILLACW